jgi:hypothetical protein
VGARHPCANPQCDKTATTKFCSRSCAATAGNLANSKRRPEHKCERCSIPVGARKRWCPSCVVEIAKEKLNVKPFTHRRTVFSSSFNGPQPRTINDPLDLFLDCLIALCRSEPEYLRARDAARYIAFMQDLKQFWTRDYWAGRSAVAAGMPTKDLKQILPDWIRSYFSDDISGLMPHYALDTAEFIQAMTHGYSEDGPERWGITPVFGPAFQRLDITGGMDRTFKRDFTRRISLRVQAVVPQNVTVSQHLYLEGDMQHPVVLGSGDTFQFAVERCHLSEDWGGGGSHFDVSPDPALPPFHLSTGFALAGQIISEDSNTQNFLLPAHWVSHEIRLKEGTWDEWELIPAPRWPTEASFLRPAGNGDR